MLLARGRRSVLSEESIRSACFAVALQITLQITLQSGAKAEVLKNQERSSRGSLNSFLQEIHRIFRHVHLFVEKLVH